ncbi:predicted protein [Haematococcus lacustris]|uniref:Uncharacterized protein n=1 Tax=Haematococcus lacustris TaxID=44745 RepID=A0A699ZY05_HAELA|nr:predicted protein [Haematococcus lacustris]
MRPTKSQMRMELLSRLEQAPTTQVSASDEHCITLGAFHRRWKRAGRILRFIIIWMAHKAHKWRWALASSSLLLLMLGHLLFWYLSLRHQQFLKAHYSVYLDGGSSGSRVHIFQYNNRQGDKPTYAQLILPEKVFAVEPGLSSYAGRPAMAATSILPLLEFAYQHVSAPTCGCANISSAIPSSSAY